MNNYDKIVNFYLAMFYYFYIDDFSLDNKNFFKFNRILNVLFHFTEFT